MTKDVVKCETSDKVKVESEFAACLHKHTLATPCKTYLHAIAVFWIYAPKIHRHASTILLPILTSSPSLSSILPFPAGACVLELKVAEPSVDQGLRRTYIGRCVHWRIACAITIIFLKEPRMISYTQFSIQTFPQDLQVCVFE